MKALAARLAARAQARVASVKQHARARVRVARVRWHWVDHLLRTWHRYQVTSGDRLAGAVTYFAFLSFFPLIALAFALVGYAVTVHPAARDTLQQAINEQLPGLAGELSLQDFADARVGAGIIGLLGLLYTGLGAMDALREALREVWMSTRSELNFIQARLRDLAALAMIGTTVILSVLIGGAATGATGTVAGWFGLSDSVVARAVIWAVALSVSVLADILVYLVILGWLVEEPVPVRVLLRGALIGAVGFQLLKRLATLLLSHTLTNPIYGTFAVIVGLLLWINVSARLTLYTAAWTATAAMGPPPEPTPLPSNASPAVPGASAALDGGSDGGSDAAGLNGGDGGAGRDAPGRTEATPDRRAERRR